MRGILLWVAAAVAAIATGLGLYATALQTSPASSVTNTPAAATATQLPASQPGPGAPSLAPHDGTVPDDHGSAPGRVLDDNASEHGSEHDN